MMIKHLPLSVLAVSTTLLAACGPPPGDAVGTMQSGVVETRGEDGVLRRTSRGYEGYVADLAHYRQRLQDLKAAPRADPKLVAGLSGIVARLEQLKVEPAPPSLSSPQQCGVSGYLLEANVYPGFAYGSSEARAGYTEFGPASPWGKSLSAFAYASSGVNTDWDVDFASGGGAGSFSTDTVSAVTGPDFCQYLFAEATIDSPDCPYGGYDASSAFIDTCAY